jgi:FkbM family methyltransferase
VDNVDYSPAMVQEVVRSGVLAEDPLVVVDVGCGMGIDPVWRLFEPALQVEAFDPQLDEIERLRSVEPNPNVHYHAALVGLDENDPFLVEQRVALERDQAHNPWPRLSTSAALGAAAAEGPVDLEERNDWSLRELASAKVGLGSFLRDEGVRTVDFVKTDTDGADLEVLRSLGDAIEPLGILGFMVETPFTGADSDTAHTFSNVDRFMKRHGFALFTLSVNRYSRAALPAPFTHAMLAQTEWGQPIWGDLVYLRDGGWPDVVSSPAKLLKLACLHEVFRVPDVAAETLLLHRPELEPLVDVDRLLDLLTPPLHGRQVSYAEYVAAFEADPTSFYPEQQPQQQDEQPSLLERLRRRAR